MRVGQLSDKGSVRQINEDSVYSSKARDLFIIADGMGGHKAGEVASKLAVNKVKYFIKNKSLNNKKTEEKMLSLICEAIEYANKSIYALASKDDNLKGMGTTIIVALACQSTVYIGHVGDSRAYLISNQSISQITSDHSLAEELFKNGSITKEQAMNYPHKNVITRALGCIDKIMVDTHIINLNKGDSLLLCTDGLSNMISNEEIFNIVNSNTPNKAVRSLIDSANKAGGIDNVSAIIINNN